MAEKKYKKTITTKSGRKKTVKYGAKGYSISPGTSKGDSYCARSLGIKKKLKKTNPKKANDPNSPNNLSRKAWGCVGAKSHKSKASKTKRA